MVSSNRSEPEDLPREGKDFSGVIYAHQLRITIGQMVADLELIATATSVEEWSGKILHLPLE